jgi:hypothetical protein
MCGVSRFLLIHSVRSLLPPLLPLCRVRPPPPLCLISSSNVWTSQIAQHCTARCVRCAVMCTASRAPFCLCLSVCLSVCLRVVPPLFLETDLQAPVLRRRFQSIRRLWRLLCFWRCVAQRRLCGCLSSVSLSRSSLSPLLPSSSFIFLATANEMFAHSPDCCQQSRSFAAGHTQLHISSFHTNSVWPLPLTVSRALSFAFAIAVWLQRMSNSGKSGGGSRRNSREEKDSPQQKPARSKETKEQREKAALQRLTQLLADHKTAEAAGQSAAARRVTSMSVL